MAPVTPRRRRARPVADAPIDSLLSRSDDLAKGWLLALLEQAPLSEAAEILAADLIRDGPRLCDAVARAMADEIDLRRLEPGGALRGLAARAGEMAGCSGPAAVSAAVDTLRAVVWSALRDELRGSDPDLVSDLSERLALIGELVRGAALERLEEASGSGKPTRGTGREAFRGAPDAGSGGRSATVWGAARARDLSAVPEPAPREVAAVAEAQASRGSPEALRGPAEASRGVAEALCGSAEASRGVAEALCGSAEAPRGPAEALWVGALDDEIERAVTGDRPLSLLLAELEEVDRVASVEPPGEAGATFGRFTRAVRGAVRRQEILACESDTRAWIIAPDAGRSGARALASRVAGAVRLAQPWRGAPLAASVGIAVLGEDGRTSSELIEAAEEARFGAAASGVGHAPEPDPA
ncbi:MAG: hypothetical protein ACLPZR_15340 [Solirubrobacteraceae bacterium]